MSSGLIARILLYVRAAVSRVVPQDPLIRQYYSRVRRSCYVLDDIPDWADIGPYW